MRKFVAKAKRGIGIDRECDNMMKKKQNEVCGVKIGVGCPQRVISKEKREVTK